MPIFRFLGITFLLLTVGSSLAWTQSNALNEYRARMTFFQRNLAIAYVASLCRIRSNQYFALFNMARQKVIEGETAKQRLSPKEWSEAQNDLNAVLQTTFVQIKFETNGQNTLASACSY